MKLKALLGSCIFIILSGHYIFCMRFPTARDLCESNQYVYATAPIFIRAIIDGDFDTVKQEYEHNKEQLNTEHAFRSPLHYALKNDQWAIAEFLIEQGATLDFKMDRSNTPLHIAACYGLETLVSLMLLKGGSNYLETKNCYNETPLECAFERCCLFSDDVKERILLLLMSAGASLLCRKSNKPLIDRIYEREIISVDLVLCDETDDETPDELNFKLLSIRDNKNKALKALRYVFESFKFGLDNNNKEHCRALIKHGSAAIQEGINSQNEQGNTLLHVIATSQPRSLRNAKAKLLLTNGANPNITNKEGMSPLHIAIKNHDRALISLLLGFDAKINFALPKDRKPTIDELNQVDIYFKNQSMLAFITMIAARINAETKK